MEMLGDVIRAHEDELLILSRRAGGGATPAEAAFLEALRRRGVDCFTLGEAREIGREAGIGEEYLRRRLLGRLVLEGIVVRLKRGLYCVNHGEDWIYATNLVRPSAISHHSALNHHGFTEQVPAGVVFCTTPRKVTTPAMRPASALEDAGCSPSRRESDRSSVWRLPGGVLCEYVSIRPHLFFGIEEVEYDLGLKLPVTDRERTVLDLFGSPRLFAFGDCMEVIESFHEEIDVGRLAGYALRYGSAAVVKRLGWVLEEAGVEEPAAVEALLRFPARGIRPLDPHRPRQGPVDARWGVQLNLPSYTADVADVARELPA